MMKNTIPMHCKPRPTAFTFLEMLTVLIISMILLVIGFSGVRLFQRQLPVQSAASRLSHALSTARSFAISQNRFYRPSLDLDRSNFWIDEVDASVVAGGLSSRSQIAKTPKVVSPERIDDRARIEGVLLTGVPGLQTTGFQFFIFRPDGSADRDARIFLYQVSDDPAIDSNITTLRLYGPTGHNKVFRGQRI